jgi:hypothetical protein
MGKATLDEIQYALRLLQNLRGRKDQDWYCWEKDSGRPYRGNDRKEYTNFHKGLKTLLTGGEVPLLLTFKKIHQVPIDQIENFHETAAHFQIIIEDVLGISGHRYLMQIDILPGTEHFDNLVNIFNEDFWPTAKTFNRGFRGQKLKILQKYLT